LLFVPATAGLLASISLAPRWGWMDLKTIVLTATSLALLATWVASELRAASPLMDVRLMLDPRVAAANLTMLLSGLTVLQATQIISLLLQQPSWTGTGLGLSATVAGLVLLPQSLTGFLGGPGTGWLMTRVGERFTVTLGAALLTLGWLGLLAKHDHLLFISAMAMVQGLGMSILYSASPMLIIKAAPPNRTSESVGMPAVFRQIGMGLGAQVTAVLLGSSTVTSATTGGAFPTAAAFTATLGYVTVGGFACLLVAFVLLGPLRPVRFRSQNV
jgi:MFS family permease